jgi:hypothetical protein
LRMAGSLVSPRDEQWTSGCRLSLCAFDWGSLCPNELKY